MHYDLGYFDLEQETLQPLDNPERHEVVTHVSGTTCYLCLWAGHGLDRSSLAERVSAILRSNSVQHRFTRRH
jgi:hypothetical protein